MIEKLMKLVRGDSGNVLVVTLLILFAIAIIGSTVAMVSTMDLKISGNQRASTRAFFVAEAGLNEAIHRLTIADPTIVTVGGWTGNAAIGDSEPYDPNWTAMIYLTSPSTAPASGGSIVRTGTIQDPSGTYLEYSSQAGTDGVLTIQHKWRDRNGDGNRDQNEIVRYDPIMVPPENFTSGKPVEVVTVTGRSAGGMTVIQAEISKQRVLVRTLGALYVDKAISLKGNCAFCGYNHSHNTPPGTRPDTKKGGAPECYSWHTASGHLPGVTSTGDKIDVKGSVDVSGNPVPIDNSAANPFYSLAEVLGLPQSDVDKLLSGADNTTIVNPLNGITYIQGDATFNSNLTGEGLIYVTGDMTGGGNFTYKGLIYVEGDLKLTGTPWILGSVIVRGTSDFNFSAGKSGVLYSSEALIRALDSSMPAIILSWQDM